MKTTLVGSKFEHMFPFNDHSQLNQNIVAHNPNMKQHTSETHKTNSLDVDYMNLPWKCEVVSLA